MIPYRTRERGEGQIGCIVTLVVLIAAGALAVKVMPVYYSDYNLQDFAGELATKAGIFPIPALELQIRDKARELEIPEAMAKGAITITTAGEKSAGSCTITLHYSRTVDLYGITPMVISTDKTFTRAYMDVR
jgi:hypothetical protein